MQKVKTYVLNCSYEIKYLGEYYLNPSHIVYAATIYGEYLGENSGKFARIYLSNKHILIIECSVLDSYLEK